MTEASLSTQGEPLIASLPMYDLPELRHATDALWQAISTRLLERGVPAPRHLTRDDHPLCAAWTSPRLLLSQTCGSPFVTSLRESAVLVATPVYRAPGCDGPFRRSAVIVHAESAACELGDLRGGRCAVNEPDSDSGMNLLRAEIAPLAAGSRFFSQIVYTGSHLASIESVAAGQSDVAAIDAVTYALLKRLRPELTADVRLLVWTVSSPGLPLITHRRASDHIRTVLRAVLVEVATDPWLKEVRSELMLVGFADLAPAHYRSILRLAQMAAENGYPELC
jgi:ABC-type phosphate/phosphonate transport system substrate-binding protein